MVKNGQKWMNMVKNGQNLVKSNQKWSKTALDGPLLAKFLKSDVKIEQSSSKNGFSGISVCQEHTFDFLARQGSIVSEVALRVENRD